MAVASHVCLFIHVMAVVTPSNLAGVVPGEFLAPAIKTNTSLTVVHRAAPNQSVYRISDEEELLEMLHGIRSAFGSSSVAEIEHNVRQIGELLFSIFASSPKNVYGRLDDVAARYALRRVLMERHGWDLPSLADDSSQHDTPLVALLGFGSSLPSQVRALLEQRVANQGAGILELSIFVASLEQTVYSNVPRQLEIVYRALGVPLIADVDADRAVELIDLYMGAYVMSQDLSHLSVPEVFSFRTNLPYTYINWAGATRFFRGIQASLVPGLQNFTFSNLSYVLFKIQSEFVHFIHDQCSGIKAKLLDFEADSTGRVRLLDFYKAALFKNMSEFTESMEYLKDLGVLDESDPLDPRLVISNYLDGPSNCFANSNLYSVCCVDECADLYGHIERIVNKPEASPEQIISTVKRLASPSMQRGRLSSAIVRRIYDIAEEHGGSVPLHGPDFSEWMHFAYPRECTHPKMFGPAHSQHLDEWETQTHSDAVVTDDQLGSYISDLEDMEARRIMRDNADGEDSCWTWNAAPKNFTFDDGEDESETLAVDHQQDLQPSQALGSGFLRCMALLFCVIGFVSSALHHCRTTTNSKKPKPTRIDAFV
eukprot:TRINITY_DN37_c0_g1_i1.p1 TRINITY_DN37_c0_g1~~TRINITY_DN37_c0_g1_i1.p1  ORF type:complete len:596 (-),score=81.25 TRINITY_DN37_c0_g1_i1:54-1841(-)